MKKITICLLACSLFAAQKTITLGASDDITFASYIGSGQEAKAIILAKKISLNPSELAIQRGNNAIKILSDAGQKAKNPEVAQAAQDACAAIKLVMGTQPN